MSYPVEEVRPCHEAALTTRRSSCFVLKKGMGINGALLTLRERREHAEQGTLLSKLASVDGPQEEARNAPVRALPERQA